MQKKEDIMQRFGIGEMEMKMAKVTVDTFGVTYPEPETVQEMVKGSRQQN